MLTIRLSRVGKKNKPTYRLVISEKAKDPYGHALEILGSYNPHNKELKVNSERINYWISKGSGMSSTVNNLLIDNKIIEGDKQKATKVATKKNVAKQKEAEKKKKEKAEKEAEEAKEAKEEKVEDSKEENEKITKEEKEEEKKTEESKEEEKK